LTESESRWTKSGDEVTKSEGGSTDSEDGATEFDDDVLVSAADPTPDFRIESLAAIPPVLEALGCA
jgi:hypothetical protein